MRFLPGAWKCQLESGEWRTTRPRTPIAVLSESGAIARHLARLTCIDGASLEEKAKVDMYYELAKDIKAKLAGMHDEAHADAKSLQTFLGHAEAACACLLYTSPSPRD